MDQVTDITARGTALDTDPMDAVRDALGMRDAGDHDRAIDLLRVTMREAPRLEAAAYELAFIHRLRGEPLEASRVLSAFQHHGGSGNRTCLLLGHMLHALGAHDEADRELDAYKAVDAEDRERLSAMFAFGEYLRRFPLGRALHLLDRLKLDNGWLETVDVASRIASAIANRHALALVRLGDGEGGMLRLNEKDEADYRPLYDRNRRELTRIWFGDSFDWHDPVFFDQARRLPDALTDIGVLGVPYESWVRHEYKISSLRGVPSLVNILRQLAATRGARALCSQHIHLDLFREGFLTDLLKLAKRISIISCLPEVGDLVQTRLGLEDVSLHLIPAEQGSKHILGEHAFDGVHFPDAFNRLQSELSVDHDGRLFLVAAGLMGKFYCATIKRHGGIALDVGSLVDGWVGRQTRPGYDQTLRL